MRRVLIGFAAASLSSFAFGHHSRASYDQTAEIVVEGTVAALEWKNPHISVTLETEGPDGAPYLQEVEAMSVSEALALGLRKDAIAPGAQVSIRAHPSRSGSRARVLGLDVTTRDGDVLPLNLDAGIAVLPAVAVQARGLSGHWAPLLEDARAAVGAMINWPFKPGRRDALERMLGGSEPLLGICADFPPPLLSVFPELHEIEIGDDVVVLRFEAQGQNLERVVVLNEAAHPVDVAPTLLGHSIGHFEGATLVIDTIGFERHPLGVMFGIPSGPDKHMVERLTLTADRLHIRYEMWMEDSEQLTEAVSLSMLWAHRPDLEPSGIACDPALALRLVGGE